MRLAVTIAALALAQEPPSTPPEKIATRCVPQQSIWKQGIEFRHALCSPGVDVEVSPRPVPGFMGAPSPLAYMVAIHNYSSVRIESDPAQWRLFWTEKNGTPREDPTLNARQVGFSRLEQSFGRSTIFAGQSASGFVYFKKPKSKDAMIAVVFAPEQGPRITAQIEVSTTPVPLLP